MLRFNVESQFYKDNADLVRQYEQTKHMLDKRDKKAKDFSANPPQRFNLGKKTTAAQVTDSVRGNLKAQVASLLSKALTKHGDNYLYLDFLFDNLVAIEKIFKDEKVKSKEDLHVLKQIEELKNYYVEKQKNIFNIAHTRSLTREDVMACGPFVSLLYASAHEPDKQLFKYDSLLHYVTRLGDASSVQVLLQAGFDVDCYKPDYNYKDKKNTTVNTTPLGIAIASDNTNVARVLLAAGASMNKHEFVTAASKTKLTDNIQSQDMRSLLIDFCLDRVEDNPLGYSFTEQVLLAANRRLADELTALHKKIDQLSERSHKREGLSSGSKASFFDEPLESKEEDRPQDTRSLKKSKMSDVD